MNPAKMAEPIKMLFELWTWVGPGNHVLDGDPDPPCKGAILRGKGAAHCEVSSAMRCAETAELTELPYGMWVRVGPEKHY